MGGDSSSSVTGDRSPAARLLTLGDATTAHYEPLYQLVKFARLLGVWTVFQGRGLRIKRFTALPPGTICGRPYLLLITADTCPKNVHPRVRSCVSHARPSSDPRSLDGVTILHF